MSDKLTILMSDKLTILNEHNEVKASVIAWMVVFGCTTLIMGTLIGFVILCIGAAWRVISYAWQWAF